ncbi:MAG: hypothetical protein KGN77_17315, partial [Xanthomonadaceae bacterium]|nr:hypothetical protein [Xanthomonadaceae bacterium]
MPVSNVPGNIASMRRAKHIAWGSQYLRHLQRLEPPPHIRGDSECVRAASPHVRYRQGETPSMSSHRRRILSFAILSALAVMPVCAATAPASPSSTDAGKGPFAQLKFRNLGPAIAGGRVSAVAGIPGDPLTFYVGAAAGGVWKTTDGGEHFKPIFNHEASASIGAIALAPSNPNLVWVGTGES